MELSIAVQLRHCLFACGLGLCMGLYYCVFRVIRVIAPPSRWALFCQDVFFFASVAVLTFLFCLATMEGVIRWYVFVGEAVGFFACHFTVGRIVTAAAAWLVRGIRRVWAVVREVLLTPFRLLRRAVAPLVMPAEKFGQKALLFFKKVLQRLGGVVYNKNQM